MKLDGCLLLAVAMGVATVTVSRGEEEMGTVIGIDLGTTYSW